MSLANLRPANAVLFNAWKQDLLCGIGEVDAPLIWTDVSLPLAVAGGGLSVEGERYFLLVTVSLVIVATAVVWRLLILRHRQALREFTEREKAAELLAQEHSRRLKAEFESRVLAQRLLTAQEDERSHLARELHDDVTQRLARLAIDAAQAQRGIANGSYHFMREELVRLSEDVHGLAYRLHPSILDELGLVEAVRAECDRIARSGTMSLDVTVRAVPTEISRPSALCLFRVAQESLRNVVRHAQAKSVHVSLAGMETGLQLSVVDDGIGFNPAKTGARRSLGHAGMRERVQLLGGELDVESEPGHGTTIVAWVPVKENATP